MSVLVVTGVHAITCAVILKAAIGVHVDLDSIYTVMEDHVLVSKYYIITCVNLDLQIAAIRGECIDVISLFW